MASNFTFGGEQCICIYRSLTADDRWIPDPAAAVKSLDGTAVGSLAYPYSASVSAAIAEMAATTASAGSGAGTAVGSGFFQMEDVPLTVWFTGLSAATVALQFLNPHSVTWETVIPSAAWLTNPAQVVIYPGTIWRVGVITKSTDTLAVQMTYARSYYGRHA